MPVGTGGGDIRIDRRLKRLKRGETLLITQLVVKHHGQAPAVKIAGKIQKMHFEVRTAITCNSWTHTNVRNAWP